MSNKEDQSVAEPSGNQEQKRSIPDEIPVVINTSSSTQKEQSAEVEQGEVKEIGGRKGPEPTRYGDWEMNGRCIDF